MKQVQYTQEDIDTANRSINIAYILAACLAQACEDMNQYLLKINSDLRHDNKHKVKEVLKESIKLIKLLNKLEEISILRCDENSVYAYDCAKDHYYAILLRVIQILGADHLSEVRALYVYNYLKNFKDLIQMPKMEIRESMAFFGVRRRLAEGEINLEEARKCLELKQKGFYENKSDKSKASNGKD